MRFKFFVVLIFCALLIKAQSQNLVPNGGFDLLQNCPNDSSQKFLKNWYSPNGDSPDHYTSLISTWSLCNPFLSWMVASSNFGYNGHGYRLPHSGQGYAGFWTFGTYSDTTSYGEYLAVRMSDSLISGKNYCVSFWVNNSSVTHYALDAIGIAFRHDSIFDIPSELYCCTQPDVENPSGNIISDTTNWTLVEDTFTARGGERFLVIGHLKANNLTTYYPIDTIGQNSNRLAYYYIDDVSVTDCGWSGIDSHSLSSFTLSPNPSNGNFQLTGKFSEKAQLHIYNLIGQEVMKPMELPTGSNSIPINIDLAEGVYIYRIISGKEILHSDKLMIVR